MNIKLDLSFFHTWEMIDFLALLDFLELWRLHVPPPCTRPVCNILSHEAETRIAERTSLSINKEIYHVVTWHSV